MKPLITIRLKKQFILPIALFLACGCFGQSANSKKVANNNPTPVTVSNDANQVTPMVATPMSNEDQEVVNSRKKEVKENGRESVYAVTITPSDGSAGTGTSNLFINKNGDIEDYKTHEIISKKETVDPNPK